MSARSKTSSAARAVPQPAVLELVAKLVKALDEKKADDLRVLSVGAQSSITDYLILASGKANTHLRALRIELERVLDASQAPIAGVETSEGSGWIVFDAYQVMIHLFLPEQRQNYRLEQLWRDAEEIDVATMLNPVAAVPVAAPKPVKKATVKPSVAKKAPVKKAAAKAPVAKKAAVKKATSKVAAVKKTPAKKATTKQAPAKKAVVKQAPAKKAAAKKTKG